MGRDLGPAARWRWEGGWVVLGGVVARKTLKFAAATASIRKKIRDYC
jgi:hypothetical protein